MNTMEQKENVELSSEILRGCIKGDRQCQKVLYEKYYHRMLSICMRYTGNIEEARDLVQEGFVKIFSNIRHYKGSGSLEGWMRRIMVNYAIDIFRKKQRHQEFSNSMLIESKGDYLEGNTQENAEEEEKWYLNIAPETIMKAVQQLSPAYRVVFNMYVVEGFSHKEIAERLGISEGSSKSNFARAKNNLKKILIQQLKISSQTL